MGCSATWPGILFLSVFVGPVCHSGCHPLFFAQGTYYLQRIAIFEKERNAGRIQDTGLRKTSENLNNRTQ